MSRRRRLKRKGGHAQYTDEGVPTWYLKKKPKKKKLKLDENGELYGTGIRVTDGMLESIHPELRDLVKPWLDIQVVAFCIDGFTVAADGGESLLRQDLVWKR